MNTAKLIFDIWVDGGNTEGLLQEVKYAYPWDTYELYADLLSKSPYLSDSVLQAVICQSILPDIMVKYILIANPQSLRSNFLSGFIYDCRYGMFSSYTEESAFLYENDTVSPRQQLEANISYFASQRKTYFDLTIKYYLADTTGNSLNYLKDMLSSETDIESQYELVFAQIKKQDYDGATTTLENIGYFVNLKNQAEEIERYNKMSSIIPILVRVETDNSWDYVSETDKDTLIYLSENDRGLPGSIARALRLQFDEKFVYNEPIYTYEDETLKMAKPIRKTHKALSNESYMKINPNPADEFIIISYNINDAINRLRLFITDASGKTIIEKELYKAKDQQMQTVKNYAKGNYICTLFNNGKPIKSVKFIKK